MTRPLKVPFRERPGLYLAMFSAGNAVDPRYEQFLPEIAATYGDAEVAAALAGVEYLELVHPYAKDQLARIRTTILTGISASDQARYQSLGQVAAKRSVERIEETTGPIPDYIPFAAPGVYVPTPIPRSNSIGLVQKPFALPSVDALRPSGPPSIDSDLYAKDLTEVARLGGRFNSTRTDEQTAEAVLWIEFRAWEWFPELVAASDLDLLEQSRLAMLFQMAFYDGTQAMIDSKAHFQFWRPVTAIRRAELDGREDTTPDTSWLPLLETPNHSEYLSGHCQQAASAAYALNALLPLSDGAQLTAPLVDYSPRIKNQLRAVDYDFSLVDGVTTTVSSFDEFRDRKCEARIYSGAHYRTTNEHSIEIGSRAAEIVLSKVARPLIP